MDWIKIKTGHILYRGYTPEQIGTLVQIQCLVAMAETPLTEEQLLINVHKSSYKSLQNALETQGISIQYVIDKVIEDVEKVSDMRGKAKNKMAQYRQKPSPVTRNVTGQIREDKIIGDREEREDKKGESLTLPDPEQREIYMKEAMDQICKNWTVK